MRWWSVPLYQQKRLIMKTVKASYIAKFVSTTNVIFISKSGNRMIAKAVFEDKVLGTGLYVYNVADMTKPIAKIVD